MKLGIFTDSHYCGAEVLCQTRRPSLSLSKIREAMEAFREEKVDACICLGDMTDHARTDTKNDTTAYYRQAIDVIQSYRIPFYFVPGNHDYLMMKGSDLFTDGVQSPPYAISLGGYRLIFLDANFRSCGRRFDIAGEMWDDSNLPREQLEFLKNELEGASEECIIFVHENLDPFVEEHHVIKNAEEIRNIIKKSDKVKLVLQGHYHPGADHIIDGIAYVTLPAMCEGEENSYRILTLP